MILSRLVSQVARQAGRLGGARWPLPPAVEDSIRQLFGQTHLSIPDRITRATEALLAARVASIPNFKVRAVADQNLARLKVELHSFGAADPYPELPLFRVLHPDYSDLERLKISDAIRLARETARHHLSGTAPRANTKNYALRDITLIRLARWSNGGVTHTQTGRICLSPEVDWRNLLYRVPWAVLTTHEMDHVATMGGA